MSSEPREAQEQLDRLTIEQNLESTSYQPPNTGFIFDEAGTSSQIRDDVWMDDDDFWAKRGITGEEDWELNEAIRKSAQEYQAQQAQQTQQSKRRRSNPIPAQYRALQSFGAPNKEKVDQLMRENLEVAGTSYPPSYPPMNSGFGYSEEEATRERRDSAHLDDDEVWAKFENGGFDDERVTGAEDWDMNEAKRESAQAQVQQRKGPRPNPIAPQHRALRSAGVARPSGGFKKKNVYEEEQIPLKYWDDLKPLLTELTLALRADEEKRQRSLDPVQMYMNRLDHPETIKIYDEKHYGFKILQNEKTATEQAQIDRANLEMLKFAYSRFPGAGIDENQLEDSDLRLWQGIENFILVHGAKSFRPGAFSVAIDFLDVLPNLTWRSQAEQAEVILLRPVLIDGVAILDATEPTGDLWTPFTAFSPQMPIYDPHLNYPVKALFDIILDFLIRGHKVVAYLPKYYEQCVGDGNIAKVDDVFVFRKLIELEFIKFHDVQKNNRWFDDLRFKVNITGSVFVSSIAFRRRTEEICYDNPADRIISACFLNTEERVMVVEPTIRYKEKGTAHFKILEYTNAQNDPQIPIREQLYLDQQIKLICQMCQLYPAKHVQKLSIKQLLALAIHSESGFEMPGMDLETFLTLNNG
uniref:RNase_Zc3h12a_2 domain-containing protein n=1 Tax=Caenorhabditis tropicalis TaxID=1561998 RepID=A0A1I7UZU6_9PELO